MQEKPLIVKSRACVLNIMNFCNEVKNASLKDQLFRSGTSVGATIHEANYAISRADFITKIQIVLKKCLHKYCGNADAFTIPSSVGRGT